ncbi:DUF6452 family protein [Galbibacter sp. EGI 63066]|uniref:DUF6452 family protein n=1 Tax=Galbibacter sp. EGI 63066 TaxID=2993559 RepID=UPI0022491D00|nr:DUF6452 family protein [Galbibacter sp. EGI 63066]MCX2681527.1 DUF6452 family protein [Galbibacter sp. EGI 63066]
MKKILTVLFITSLGTAFFSACERDDICPPGDLTTPVLKVGFYNLQNQDSEKRATRLRIRGMDSVGDTLAVLNTFPDRTHRTEVDIPLKTYENSSTFQFIFDSASDEDGNETGNIDTIQFNYVRQERFVSRGCGYAVSFDRLEAVLNPEQGTTSTEGWISSIFVQDRNIQHQDTIHVKIYH